jgi:hypothetical protein
MREADTCITVHKTNSMKSSNQIIDLIWKAISEIQLHQLGRNPIRPRRSVTSLVIHDRNGLEAKRRGVLGPRQNLRIRT